jgi:hypothetical protein
MSASSEQIAAEMGAKHYAKAEVMLNQVIQEHPNSAKAYFYLAQVQYKEGKLGAAESSLNTYKELAPNDTHFSADPGAVAEIEAGILSAHPHQVVAHTAQPSTVYVSPRHHDDGMSAFAVVLILSLIAATVFGIVWAIIASVRRRPDTIVYNNTVHDSYPAGGCPVGYGYPGAGRPYTGVPTGTATAVPPVMVQQAPVVVHQVPVGGGMIGPGYGGYGGMTGGGLLGDMMAINMMENIMDHNHGGGQVVNETVVNNTPSGYSNDTDNGSSFNYGNDSSDDGGWGSSSDSSSDWGSGSDSSSDWS